MIRKLQPGLCNGSKFGTQATRKRSTTPSRPQFTTSSNRPSAPPHSPLHHRLPMLMAHWAPKIMTAEVLLLRQLSLRPLLLLPLRQQRHGRLAGIPHERHGRRRPVTNSLSANDRAASVSRRKIAPTRTHRLIQEWPALWLRSLQLQACASHRPLRRPTQSQYLPTMASTDSQGRPPLRLSQTSPPPVLLINPRVPTGTISRLAGAGPKLPLLRKLCGVLRTA